MVPLNQRSARRTQLHKRKPPLGARCLLQEALNGAKALIDSLGVIDSVDSDPEILRADTELLEHTFSQQRCGGVCLRWPAEIVGRKTNREGFDEGHMVMPIDGELLPINAGFDESIDGVQKVVAMELDVKPQEVGPEHAIKQLTRPWTDGEGFGVRPGDVPKQRHPRIRALGFDEPWQEG